MRLRGGTLLLLGAALLFPCAARATWLVSGDPADQLIRSDGNLFNVATGRLGASTSGFAGAGGRVAVYVFQLPTPAASELPTVTHASFRFTITADQADGLYNIDLYGLASRHASTVFGTDYYAGSSDGTADSLIKDNIIPMSHPAGSLPEVVETNAMANGNLAAYLSAQYRPDGSSGAGDWVFLRLNPDRVPPIENTGVDVAYADNATGRPVLTIDFLPEPGLATVSAVSSLLVGRPPRGGRRRRPRRS